MSRYGRNELNVIGVLLIVNNRGATVLLRPGARSAESSRCCSDGPGHRLITPKPCNSRASADFQPVRRDGSAKRLLPSAADFLLECCRKGITRQKALCHAAPAAFAICG